jgi:hypothetical protein
MPRGYLILFIFCLFSGHHPSIRVSLKNAVINKYEYLQGNYQASSEVNGQTSWVKGAYAIWSMRNGRWIFGKKGSIGEKTGMIHSKQLSGLTDGDSEWKYFVGGFCGTACWIHPSDPKDIEISYNHGKY